MPFPAEAFSGQRGALADPQVHPPRNFRFRFTSPGFDYIGQLFRDFRAFGVLGDSGFKDPVLLRCWASRARPGRTCRGGAVAPACSHPRAFCLPPGAPFQLFQCVLEAES